MYCELGLESLRDRRWYRRLVFFYNIVKGNSPSYLSSYLPGLQIGRNSDGLMFKTIFTRTDYFANSFFPFCVREWNKLSIELRSSANVTIFKNSMLKLIRPSYTPLYRIFNPNGTKLLTRLRVQLSHLRQHKFKHNFLDTVNPLCSCSLEVESNCHYLLRCSFFINQRKKLLDNIVDIIGSLSNIPDNKLVRILLYGDNLYSEDTNYRILKSTITFIETTERFDVPLL